MDCDTALTELLLGDATAPALRAHLAGCPRCGAEAAVVRRIADAFVASPSPEPAPDLGARLLHTAGPLLSVHARRLPAVAWPRLAAAIAVALLPLPVILLAGWEALSTANLLLSSILPAGVSFYLVAAHAAALTLLLAITYGAVPLLAAHQLRLHHEETHA